MTLRMWTWVAAVLVVMAAALAIAVSWRTELRNRAALSAELAATKQALAEDQARQRDRDSKLAETLAAIAVEKRTVQSPAQIIKDLPNQIPLPVPITLQNVPPQSTGSAVNGGAAALLGTNGTHTAKGSISSGFPVAKMGGGSAQVADASKVEAVIPGQDLKPLYDFALDCKTCQAKLAASQSDLADEQGKTKALTKERDDALRIAKGGNVLQRIGRAAKWLLIGAAAGALAARAVR